MYAYTSIFKDGQQDFFRPLTGPWRACTELALVRLYDAFFGTRMSFSHCIEREDLQNLLIDAMRDAPRREEEGEGDDAELTGKDEAVHANALLRRIRGNGWIEEFEDPSTHRESYRFTRAGKDIGQALVEHGAGQVRMSQRNVRNTKNSLKAYLEEGDVYDLFMALDHSRRVIQDLADDVMEIHELRRQVIAQAAHDKAITDYVEYMKTKFAPITAIKMRADSVYRHEHEIEGLIGQIKARATTDFDAMEEAARRFRAAGMHEGSVIVQTLDEIQANLREAMRSKMSELSAAVAAYTDRTSFLALQASIVAGSRGMEAITRAIDGAAALDETEQDLVLARAFERIAPFGIELVDESVLRTRRSLARIEVQAEQATREPTREERKEAFILQAEGKAFTLSVRSLRERLEDRIAQAAGDIHGQRYFRLSEANIETYDDLLFVTHALESAYDGHSGVYELTSEGLATRVKTPYVEYEDKLIRIVAEKPREKRAARARQGASKDATTRTAGEAHA